MCVCVCVGGDQSKMEGKDRMGGWGCVDMHGEYIISLQVQ